MRYKNHDAIYTIHSVTYKSHVVILTYRQPEDILSADGCDLFHRPSKIHTMSARYTMQEMSDLNHEGETLLYPRMVITDCCPTAELAERIAATSTFSPGEAAGLIRQLADEMAAVMASGRSVRLDGIGTFTPTLALEHDKKREAPDGSGSRRNATSIRVGGVGFRVNRRLVSETDRLCHLERAACNFVRQRSPYTPEERLTRALTYLADHPWLTVADYAQLCRLSRTTAGRELRRWLADPSSGLTAKGSGSHRVYVRRPAKADGQ